MGIPENYDCYIVDAIFHSDGRLDWSDAIIYRKDTGKFEIIKDYAVNPDMGLNVMPTIAAPLEIIEKYNIYKAYEARKAEVLKRKQYWDNIKKAARLNSLKFGQVLKIIEYFPYKRKLNAISLLISYGRGRIRSEFKKSLAAQCIAWALEDNPKYKSPLSYKQEQYL